MERYNHKSNLTHDQLVELRRAFEMLDTDNSGFLEAREMKSMIVYLGEGEVTDQEADRLLQAADLDGDGRIDFHEFCIANESSKGKGSLKSNIDQLASY
jgi:calcium-dependent protein kinase